MPRWFAVEGVIGAGKTSTVELAAARLGMQAILERPDEHPLLGVYHQSPEEYAFETELIFMAMHRHEIRRAGDVDDMLSDFAPGKDIIFGALALSDDDLASLKFVDRQLWAAGEGPTAAIFLDVPIAECLRRVRSRGRAYEDDLSRQYLGRLRERYMADLWTLADEVIKVDLDGTETPSEVAGTVCGLISG
jgi:deoxyguanosine kinase